MALRGLRAAASTSLCNLRRLARPAQQRTLANASLADTDPEMYALVNDEKRRQRSCLELIASENFTSRAVMEVNGSCLTNKYSEGQVGARYYGGTDVIDKIETLCKTRALHAFGLDKEDWQVNVQPYSGSPANMAVLTGLLETGDKIMGLDLPSGGHLTHGFFTTLKDGTKKPISASAKYFKSQFYEVDYVTGRINHDKLAADALEYKPDMLIMGGSAYPHEWDYKRFREIADSVGAMLWMDMAHISGLVATSEADSPFDYCDIVTSTTHKTLRGPRSGLVFAKNDNRKLPAKIDFGVFPMLQGGPHQHQIGALAVQFKEVATPEFKQYIAQVRSNAVTLSDALIAKGYKISGGGTVNHLLLWDMRETGISGAKMQKICDAVQITLNKNTVPGDASGAAGGTGGVRIGTCAMTTRGLGDADFVKVADILDRVVKVAQAIQDRTGKKIKDWAPVVATDPDVEAIRKEVEEYCTPLFMPGVNID